MEKNNLHKELLNKYSTEELKNLIKKMKIENEKLRLNIVKKSLISYKLDTMN